MFKHYDVLCTIIILKSSHPIMYPSIKIDNVRWVEFEVLILFLFVFSEETKRRKVFRNPSTPAVCRNSCSSNLSMETSSFFYSRLVLSAVGCLCLQ